MDIRKAISSDVGACVDMVEACRLRYEAYEPRFWKKAANSAASTFPWFTQLFADAANVSLVAVEDEIVVGFLIARALPVPPVYDPGGPAALIDDFCVLSESRWGDAGHGLLAAARAILRERGFAQVVVVCGYRDEAKTRLLAETDLSLTSTWWTASA